MLPVTDSLPQELEGKRRLAGAVRTDNCGDTPRDQAPAKHHIEPFDPDFHPPVVHTTTLILLTSNPVAEDILTANFTRSRSSR